MPDTSSPDPSMRRESPSRRIDAFPSGFTLSAFSEGWQGNPPALFIARLEAVIDGHKVAAAFFRIAIVVAAQILIAHVEYPGAQLDVFGDVPGRADIKHGVAAGRFAVALTERCSPV